MAQLERRKSELTTDQFSEAKVKLRCLQKAWREADDKLGYSAALAFERDLAAQEGALAEALSVAIPNSLAEVIAKLHCVMAMQDPGPKDNEAPWPQLRTILADLVQIDRGSVADAN